MDLLEGPRIRDGYGSLVGEQSKPSEVLIEKRLAPECPENSEDFFAEDQWMASEAVNTLPAYPFWVRRQFRTENSIFDQE